MTRCRTSAFVFAYDLTAPCIGPSGFSTGPMANSIGQVSMKSARSVWMMPVPQPGATSGKYYCFYVEHQSMKPVREWASGKKLDPTVRTEYLGQKSLIEERVSNQ